MGEKTRVTAETIRDELDAISGLAKGAGQYAAAHAAVVSKAKLFGLMIERKEAGAPGDFAGMQTADDVRKAVEEELGSEVAALIGAALARREATLPGNACDAATTETIDEFPATEGNA